jgi:hypothetical protein
MFLSSLEAESPIQSSHDGRSRWVLARRLALAALLAGGFAAGLVYSFCYLFSRLPFYDDEGKMLLYTQQLLDGRAMYDQLHFIYGPSFLLLQWLVFSVLRVPLGNDGLRGLALVIWWLSAVLLTGAAWRQTPNFPWRWGLAALVWLAAIFHLNVFTNEPGHPQELIALLLAAAFWVAADVRDQSKSLALISLGVIAGALILTKINVGVFFALALAMALASLGPRPSAFWTSLRILGALAVLALPTVLMRSRLADGFWPFCLLITAALLPCCGMAMFGDQPHAFGWRHVLLCGLGLAAGGIVAIGFALSHGNTLAETSWSLVIHPFRGFAGTKFGGPLPLPRLTVIWSLVGAALGVGVLTGVFPRRLLWPLRLFACAVIFADALVARSWDSQATWLILPLMWLLLTPVEGTELAAKDWFFRLLVAFTACLQALQVFPVPGSQMHMGTLTTILVGVVLLVDLCRELEVADRLAMPSPFVLRIGLSLVVLASLELIFESRVYPSISSSVRLPSLATAWSLVGAGTALIVLWDGSWTRKLLRPLRLLASLLIFGCLAVYGWDTDWTRFVLPWAWLLLIPAVGETQRRGEMLFRQLLTLAVCLRPLRILPVDGGPFHLPTWVTLLAAVVLASDFLQVDLVGQISRSARRADWNLVTACLALVLGGVPALVAARTYESLVPLDLRGCRWTRVSEREATLLTFLTANAEASSDSFVARNGLMSLHFWADRRPASDVVLGNEWDMLDEPVHEALLSAHRDRLRMMFIDNPSPWYLDSHKLEFSKFAAGLRAHAFLDFIGQNFKQLARVANCRLLVRKERTDLGLRDCAYEDGIDPKRKVQSLLRLELPEAPKLTAAAAIDLVDLVSGQTIASTRPGGPTQPLVLFNDAFAPAQTVGAILEVSRGLAQGGEGRLFVAYPTAIHMRDVSFPALRFLDETGMRLLTLPVAVETCLPKPKLP